MVDTASLLALTRSIEEAHTSAPPLGRWLDRAKELQKELSLRIISLSRYLDDLPVSAYENYADALTQSLRDPDLQDSINELTGLDARVQEFARRLDAHGLGENARLLREAAANAIVERAL